MQLQKLELHSFGSYTETVIPFGPGLTILYGPNEAGKTTLLEAIRTLFFGLASPKRLNWYDNWTAYRLTATAAVDRDRTVEFTRTNRTSKPVEGRVAENGDDFDEAALHKALSVSRAQYRSLFGFSQAELADGERALAEDNLRDVIFGGGTGSLSRFRKLEESLKKQADELMSERSRKKEIDQQLVAIVEAQSALDRAQTKPAEYEAIRSRQREADRRASGRQRELIALRQSIRRLEQLDLAEPEWRAKLAIVQQREQLTVPDAISPAVAETILQDFRKRDELETRRTQHQDSLAEHEEAIAEAAPVAGLLDVSETIRDLGERRKSIADDRVRLDELRDRVRRRLPDPTATETADVEELTRRQGQLHQFRLRVEGLERSRAEVAAERKRVLRDIATMQGQGEEADGLPWGEVAEVLARVRRTEDDWARLQVAVPAEEQRLAVTAAQLAEHIDRDELPERISLPLDATTDASASRLLAARQDLRDCRAAAEAAAKDAADTQEQIAQLTAGGRTVRSRQELHDAREDRDRMLAAIGSGPEIESDRQRAAEAVHECDAIADERFDDAERQAKLANLETRLQRQSQQTDTAESRLREAAAAEAEAQSDWAAVWADWTDHPKTPAEMSEWTAQLKDYEKRLSASTEQRAALNRHEAVRETLAALAIDRGCVATGLDAILAWVDSAIEDDRQQRDRRRRRHEELPRLQTEADELNAQLTASDEEIAAVHAEVGRVVDFDPAAESIAGLQEQVDAALAAAVEAEQIASLTEEAEQLETRIAEFDSAAAPLLAQFADLVAAATQDESVEKLVDLRLAEFTRKATRTAEEASCERLRTQIENVDGDLREILVRLDDHRIALGLSDLAAVKQTALDVQAAAELDRSVQQIEARIRIHRGDLDESDFLDELASGSSLQREPELADLRREETRLDSELDDARKELGVVEQQLRDIEGESRVHEMQRQLEHERAVLREMIERYAPLAILQQVFQETKKRFEREQQSSLLAEVSTLLAKLTGGRHTAVKRSLADDELYIEEVAGDRTLRRSPQELSTGTRQLLYLAIRLAFIRSHTRKHRPLPVLLDDVLVHLDDDRARAVLAVLSELSEQTQIVLLSCHRRVLTDAHALGLGEVVTNLSGSQITPDRTADPDGRGPDVSGMAAEEPETTGSDKTAKMTTAKPRKKTLRAKSVPAESQTDKTPRAADGLFDA